jgi:hypothetical protein
MNEELRWRIIAFFNYWRQRHLFIQRLDFSKHSHEANVLTWASLDALSNLWAENIGKEKCKSIRKRKRLIFDAFLSLYGGEVFQLISLPDVWNRIDKGETDRGISQDVFQLLSNIGGRQSPTFLNERQLRQSSDDWNLNKIISTVLERYPLADYSQLEKWLIFSRYGSIAYKEMRSAYIHEGRPGKNSHGFSLGGSEIQPTYLSGLYSTPPAIGFKVEFMLDVLEDCIHAFEVDALSLQQDPVPVE